MASKSALEEGSQVRISGKGMARGGVEAFVFIHLHNWLPDTELQGSETRDKLFRKITDNVWKSFLAAGHCISKVTTCMVIPDDEKKACSEWKGRVDQTFSGFWGHHGFRLWCNAFVPTAVPIVVAIVSYNGNGFHNAFAHIRDRNILALHRLNYEIPYGYPFMVDRIYSNDPEGTIETRPHEIRSIGSVPNQAKVSPVSLVPCMKYV